LAKESNTRKRKIHEAAAMHVENNVISQPSINIPPLWLSILRTEKRDRDNSRKKPKRRNYKKVNKQEKRGTEKGER
jgi:hypothetical protein